MRASSTASANFSGSLEKPGASSSISHGMAISASTVTATCSTTKPDIACPANMRAASGPSA